MYFHPSPSPNKKSRNHAKCGDSEAFWEQQQKLQSIQKRCRCRFLKGALLVVGVNPFEKYQSNWIISPSSGENKKYLSCHHLAYLIYTPLLDASMASRIWSFPPLKRFFGWEPEIWKTPGRLEIPPKKQTKGNEILPQNGMFDPMTKNHSADYLSFGKTSAATSKKDSFLTNHPPTTPQPPPKPIDSICWSFINGCFQK